MLQSTEIVGATLSGDTPVVTDAGVMTPRNVYDFDFAKELRFDLLASTT
jgi:hypothetical protein